jgi:hypothetical protein
VQDRVETLPARMFEEARSADVRIGLPLKELTAGLYFMRLEASLGRTKESRELVFVVR